MYDYIIRKRSGIRRRIRKVIPREVYHNGHFVGWQVGAKFFDAQKETYGRAQRFAQGMKI